MLCDPSPPNSPERACSPPPYSLPADLPPSLHDVASKPLPQKRRRQSEPAQLEPDNALSIAADLRRYGSWNGSQHPKDKLMTWPAAFLECVSDVEGDLHFTCIINGPASAQKSFWLDFQDKPKIYGSFLNWVEIHITFVLREGRVPAFWWNQYWREWQKLGQWIGDIDDLPLHITDDAIYEALTEISVFHDKIAYWWKPLKPDGSWAENKRHICVAASISRKRAKKICQALNRTLEYELFDPAPYRGNPHLRSPCTSFFVRSKLPYRSWFGVPLKPMWSLKDVDRSLDEHDAPRHFESLTDHSFFPVDYQAARSTVPLWHHLVPEQVLASAWRLMTPKPGWTFFECLSRLVHEESGHIVTTGKDTAVYGLRADTFDSVCQKFLAEAKLNIAFVHNPSGDADVLMPVRRMISDTTVYYTWETVKAPRNYSGVWKFYLTIETDKGDTTSKTAVPLYVYAYLSRELEAYDVTTYGLVDYRGNRPGARNIFSLWTGFASPLEESAAWLLSDPNNIVASGQLIEHYLRVLASLSGSPDENWETCHLIQRLLLTFVVWKLHNPSIPSSFMPIMYSAVGGIGKSWFWNVLGKLLGDSSFSLVSDIEKVFGYFNGECEGKFFILLDDVHKTPAEWASVLGTLKSTLTAETGLVRMLYSESKKSPNHAVVAATTNQVVPLAIDRRFFVVHAGDSGVKNRPGWGAEAAELWRRGAWRGLHLWLTAHPPKLDCRALDAPTTNYAVQCDRVMRGDVYNILVQWLEQGNSHLKYIIGSTAHRLETEYCFTKAHLCPGCQDQNQDLVFRKVPGVEVYDTLCNAGSTAIELGWTRLIDLSATARLHSNTMVTAKLQQQYRDKMAEVFGSTNKRAWLPYPINGVTYLRLADDVFTFEFNAPGELPDLWHIDSIYQHAGVYLYNVNLDPPPNARRIAGIQRGFLKDNDAPKNKDNEIRPTFVLLPVYSVFKRTMERYIPSRFAYPKADTLQTCMMLTAEEAAEDLRDILSGRDPWASEREESHN